MATFRSEWRHVDNKSVILIFSECVNFLSPKSSKARFLCNVNVIFSSLRLPLEHGIYLITRGYFRSEHMIGAQEGGRWPLPICWVNFPQIIGNSPVCSKWCLGLQQRECPSSALLDIFRGIHRWPMDFPHTWPVMWEALPSHNVIIPFTASPVR